MEEREISVYLTAWFLKNAVKLHCSAFAASSSGPEEVRSTS